MSDLEHTADSSGDNSFVPARLGRLSVSTRALGFASLLVLVLIYFAYPAYPTVMGKSLAGWTWHGCNSVNGFLHGRFVPVAFGVMIWLAWKQVRNLQARPSYWGLLLLGLGFLFFLVSIRTIQPRLALIGAPFVVIGFTQYLFGFQITKHVVFPAFFLWFAIPVPGLEAILTGNLQTFITKTCYHGGLMLGMDLTLTGSNIYIAGTTLDIAEGCSGIRSLMALTMIAAVYANYTQKSLWKKAALFASSFPLAVIGNFFRIFTILLLTHFGFGDFAKKAYHDWAGLLIFFPIALSGLYLVDYLLNFKERRGKKVKRSIKKSRKVIPNTVTE
jgi:exosortase